MSKNLDFTVSGPCRPAQALLQDGYEAGDGFSMGAAPDLPCFCHKGESRRKALRTMAYLKKNKTEHSSASVISEALDFLNVFPWTRPSSAPLESTGTFLRHEFGFFLPFYTLIKNIN